MALNQAPRASDRVGHGLGVSVPIDTNTMSIIYNYVLLCPTSLKALCGAVLSQDRVFKKPCPNCVLISKNRVLTVYF
jgi:hypothetical protein